MPDCIQCLKIIMLIEIAVQAGRRNARIAQRRDLILHQRDQRRNDNCQPAHQHRRHLIADGFSGAGRHDAEHIAAGKDPVDQLFLTVPETVISEIFLQDPLRSQQHSILPF